MNSDSITALGLEPPGLVVNSLKGDPSEGRAHSFLQWESAELPEWLLMGVPFDGASVVRSGARHGPDAVREAMRNYTSYASSTGKVIDVAAGDVGDLRVVLTDMPGTFARLAAVVESVRRQRRGMVIIGGDHSITWPILEGLTRAEEGPVGVIHFDQHHDLRESHFGAESSGVPFRKALNFGQNPVQGRNLVQIGIAEFANAPMHATYAREQDVTVFTNLDVFEGGILPCVEQAIAKASEGTTAIHVSVDVDVLDQSQAPGTAAPNPHGLFAHDLYAAVRRIAREPKVASLDIVEISPVLESGNLTGAVGALLTLSFLMGVSEGAPVREAVASYD